MHQLTHEETEWSSTQHPLIIACDNWKDPRNVGMAFRLADAFGVKEIWLGGESPSPPNSKISKTARSTEKWTKYQSITNLSQQLIEAKSTGHTIWGIEITTSSLPIRSIAKSNISMPLIIVLGAESKGISQEILDLTDACYHIPMLGKNTSLNVSTALAIALHEINQAL